MQIEIIRACGCKDYAYPENAESLKSTSCLMCLKNKERVQTSQTSKAHTLHQAVGELITERLKQNNKVSNEALMALDEFCFEHGFDFVLRTENGRVFIDTNWTEDSEGNLYINEDLEGCGMNERIGYDLNG
jgi:hypothetical protein